MIKNIKNNLPYYRSFDSLLIVIIFPYFPNAFKSVREFLFSNYIGFSVQGIFPKRTCISIVKKCGNVIRDAIWRLSCELSQNNKIPIPADNLRTGNSHNNQTLYSNLSSRGKHDSVGHGLKSLLVYEICRFF